MRQRCINSFGKDNTNNSKFNWWHYREDAAALRGVEIISNDPVIEIYSYSSTHAGNLTFDVYYSDCLVT